MPNLFVLPSEIYKVAVADLVSLGRLEVADTGLHLHTEGVAWRMPPPHGISGGGTVDCGCDCKGAHGCYGFIVICGDVVERMVALVGRCWNPVLVVAQVDAAAVCGGFMWLVGSGAGGCSASLFPSPGVHHLLVPCAYHNTEKEVYFGPH